MKARLLTGDCLERLRELPDASVAAIVTDPPYGLGFMGKAWDHAVPSADVWREVLRVLRPGGHMVAFFGSRTYHRGAVAIEDAGFEVRDQLMWIYGSGFPKSLDVSKAIDKAAGASREVVGRYRAAVQTGVTGGLNGSKADSDGVTWATITAPATDAARQWNGWGTALKPAHEPIVLARKPLQGTVAANVLAHGTGAINVEACRVGTESTKTKHHAEMGYHGGNKAAEYTTGSDAGRWPANVLHDGSDEVLEHFPQTTSGTKDGGKYARGVGVHDGGQRTDGSSSFGDSGSAARFFYSPKADAEDRNEGLPRDMRNTHPTVKPVDLMRWLVKLITPPGGLVLDPFMGSGSTGKAALLDGFDFIGVDLDPKHVAIAEARLRNAGGLFVEIEVG